MESECTRFKGSTAEKILRDVAKWSLVPLVQNPKKVQVDASGRRSRRIKEGIHSGEY